MGAVLADLHVHTTRSDGEVRPHALASIAAECGLSAVAITDHERLPPGDLRGHDPAVVGGIELRVEAAGVGRVDLLGYGVDRSSTRLTETVDRLQADRIRRARAMRDRLEASLGVELDVALTRGVGRPHLARAVADRTDLAYGEVFERYIGTDGPCYVSRSVPSFGQGRELLTTASELVVLAHPMRYDRPEAAMALVDELDGVEYHYPYEHRSELDRLDDLIPDGTMRTGGSDAHSREAVGTSGLDREGLRPIGARLGLGVD